jgi:hypothetical protein
MAEYDSFLLRVWRNVGHNGPQWAGRLEHLQRGECVAVSSLEELVEHLRARAGPLAVREDDPCTRQADTER